MSQTTALSRKINNVLATNIQDEEFVLALHNLDFYTENTLSSRWNLRDTLEKENLRVHNKFLSLFSSIHDQLSQVKQHVESMREACDTMETRLQKTKETSTTLIQQADKLSKAK